MAHHVYSDIYYDVPGSSGNDCLTITGPDTADIDNCTFDLTAYPRTEQDEIISLVKGAQVRIRNSVIYGGIKAILAGNGDHPVEDSEFGRLEMQNCIIIGSGRRCPEAQDGVRVTMDQCWIADWGLDFDVRAFGAWAHKGASIKATNCIFTQLTSPSLVEWFLDHINHIGQAVNTYGLKALLNSRTYVSGFRRALTADSGGTVWGRNCYRNSPSVIVDGCDSWMSTEEAAIRAVTISAACGRPPQFALEYFDLVRSAQ